MARTARAVGPSVGAIAFSRRYDCAVQTRRQQVALSDVRQLASYRSRSIGGRAHSLTEN